MRFDGIRYDTCDGVATIALDVPETRNALSDELLDDLAAGFAAARDDAEVRCVVVTSTHDTVFSAGGNLAGLAADVPLVHKHRAVARLPDLFRQIGELGKPTLCAANGHVLAGALGLALACDLVVAKQGARFGTPEINVGLFPFMVMALAYRNVPRKRASELLLLGEQIEADEAERIGIVNRVVAPDRYDAVVAEWAARLAEKSPLMIRLGKDAIYRQQDMAMADSLDYLRGQLALAFATEDLTEGIRALFERRAPAWTGR
jgi:enoyl-CoA hydratase